MDLRPANMSSKQAWAISDTFCQKGKKRGRGQLCCYQGTIKSIVAQSSVREHTFNPRTQEAEAGGSLGVQGHSSLLSEFTDHRQVIACRTNVVNTYDLPLSKSDQHSDISTRRANKTLESRGVGVCFQVCTYLPQCMCKGRKTAFRS